MLAQTTLAASSSTVRWSSVVDAAIEPACASDAHEARATVSAISRGRPGRWCRACAAVQCATLGVAKRRSTFVTHTSHILTQRARNRPCQDVRFTKNFGCMIDRGARYKVYATIHTSQLSTPLRQEQRATRRFLERRPRRQALFQRARGSARGAL